MSRLRDLRDYARVFSGYRDLKAFRDARDRPESCQGPVRVRVRGVPGPGLEVRPGTMDAVTLWDAFHGRDHLPRFPFDCRGWIVSLGANAGYVTAELASRFSRARVLAVELDADNARLARRNVAPFGDRCIVVAAAVSDVDGEEVRYGGRDVHDLAVVDGEGTAASRTATTVTVDRLLERHRIERVDFLKMDIEGAEARVLAGTPAWLARVEVISLEVHPPAASYRDCLATLAAAGFDCQEGPRCGPIRSIYGRCG